MSIPRLALVCLTMAVAAFTPVCKAMALETGDRLPALTDVAWIDGRSGAGDSAAPDAVTVVDLWSPDNAACRATMPRLTDLQKRHPEVRVIGLTDASDAATRRFVTGMGSRIGYGIGVVPALKAFAPSVGAPCALIVDRRGTVVWWGDAMDVPGPLARVLDGTFVPEAQPATVLQPASPIEVVPRIPEEAGSHGYIERPERRTTVIVGVPQVVCVPHPCWWALSVHGGACSGHFIIPHPPLILLPPFRCFWR